MIAFLDALLHSDATDLKRMLVIVPKNTISNWVDEFQRWLNDENDYYVSVHVCKSCVGMYIQYLTI